MVAQFIFSFLVGGILLMLILSIIHMVVVKPGLYFKQLKSLWGFSIDKSFFMSQKINAAWGTRVVPISSGQYFFINVKSDKCVIMIKVTDWYLDYFTTMCMDKIKDEWVYNDIKYKPSACPIVGLLKYIVKLKIKSNRLNWLPVEIDKSSELDNFINSEIVQIGRDKKIKTILNEIKH